MTLTTHDIEPAHRTIDGVLSEPDNSHLDERDQQLLAAITSGLGLNVAKSPQIPLEGEFLYRADGTRARVAHVHRYPKRAPLSEVSVQPSHGGASVHITLDGDTSFSGGLSSGIKLPNLTLTGDTEPARFWMWHHGRVAGGNGIDIYLPVRVWKVNA